MTILFSDGQRGSTMETAGDLSAWTIDSGSPTTTGSPVYDGNYAAKLRADTFDRIVKALAASSLYFGFWFQYDVQPANGESVIIADMSDSSDYHVRIRIYNDGGTIKWQLLMVDNGYVYRTETAASPNPVVNTWYWVEFWGSKNVANGAKLWVNGNLIITSAYTSVNLDLNAVRLYHRCDAATVIYGYYDIIKASDTYMGPQYLRVASKRLLLNVGV